MNCDILYLVVPSGLHQTGNQRVLVPLVMRKLQPGKKRIFFVQMGDQLPGCVPAAVIDEQNPAFLGDRSCLDHPAEIFRTFRTILMVRACPTFGTCPLRMIRLTRKAPRLLPPRRADR